MIGGIAARLEVIDPGAVRTRRGVRAAGATVLAWATMLAVTAAFDVADPLRITLFAAGAAFEGALLAPDPLPRDRLRTLGWATLACSGAVVATVQLSLIGVWVAAGFLVLLMFASFALRSWSARAASLALMGAITVYITGGGHITPGRVGWFVLAAVIGFGWLALWESVLLPDDPLRSLARSVQAFSRRAADTVDDVVNVLNEIRGVTPSGPAGRGLHVQLERVRSCRSAIERQIAGAVVRGLRETDADHLRVALHSAQKALQDMAEQVRVPNWAGSLPEDLAGSITDGLHTLAVDLRDHAAEDSTDLAARSARTLRGHMDAALARTATTSAPRETTALLAALSILSEGEVVAQSVTQATLLTSMSEPPAPSAPSPDPSAPPDPPGLSPTMALAIQAVVAAVVAGGIATVVGNEQRLVVAWTAFVIIAGSAGLSTRRAMVRIPATIVGAVAGVLLAATVPDTVLWTVAVVAIGVFFTIVTAPVSYPAMVFWMGIAFVPLFAQPGSYLDLIIDKGVAALIGGCVAAIVALTVVPIRVAHEVRPAVLEYLAALDTALASHLPGHEGGAAPAEAALDAAHAALASKVTSAAVETNVFSQPANVGNEEAARVDAVHDGYQRLTPLLSDSSRALHGWSDEQFTRGIRRLRAAVARAASMARGEAVHRADTVEEPLSPAKVGAATRPGLADSLQRVHNLHGRLSDLTAALSSSPGIARSR